MGDHWAHWASPSPSPEPLDYSQPIAILLKHGTHDVHAAAHRSEGATQLIRGVLPKSQYILYLYMLWHVYGLLEDLLENHNDDPVIGAFAHPRISGRTLCLADDIDHLLGHQEWRSISPDLLPIMTESLQIYLGRLTSLGQNSPELLLAHIYVRILGDLSGGQYIRRQVQKAYQLEEESLSFYRFGRSQEDVSKTKLWFKSTMNEAVAGHDYQLKGAFHPTVEDVTLLSCLPAQLVVEARLAFTLNVALLESLLAPSL